MGTSLSQLNVVRVAASISNLQTTTPKSNKYFKTEDSDHHNNLFIKNKKFINAIVGREGINLSESVFISNFSIMIMEEEYVAEVKEKVDTNLESGENVVFTIST